MQVFVKAKSLFASKLFWLGALQISIGISELVVQYLENPELGVGSIVSGALTIILRYVTKQPVSVTGQQAKAVEAVEGRAR